MASKAVAAKASPAAAGKKLHAPQPHAKVKINFKEPLKTGFLSKAGKTNKSFKNRFFVLYKNFLVYYDDETKWRRDVTVERLEVNIAQQCTIFQFLFACAVAIHVSGLFICCCQTPNHCTHCLSIDCCTV